MKRLLTVVVAIFTAAAPLAACTPEPEPAPTLEPTLALVPATPEPTSASAPEPTPTPGWCRIPPDCRSMGRTSQ